MRPPDGRRLSTAPCGIRTKWPSGKRVSLYYLGNRFEDFTFDLQLITHGRTVFDGRRLGIMQFRPNKLLKICFIILFEIIFYSDRFQYCLRNRIWVMLRMSFVTLPLWQEIISWYRYIQMGQYKIHIARDRTWRSFRRLFRPEEINFLVSWKMSHYLVQFRCTLSFALTIESIW